MIQNKRWCAMKEKLFNNIVFKNASWLMLGKVMQMLLSLAVSVLTARYLGPQNYGLINYGASYVALFSSLCTLGINSVIVKEFVDNPEQQGEAIGTTLLLRATAAFLSIITIVAIVLVVDQNEPTTIVVVAICSLSLFFHIFEIFNYWFQSQYKSKVTAITTFAAYAAVSLYKLILLINGADVYWFAFSTSLDYICVAVLLYCSYRKNHGPRLSFSKAKAKELLSKSYHYILAGIMVSIYGQTDKFMLKHMLDESSVGYYSISTVICGMWTFVLAAIIDAMVPRIAELHKENKEIFLKKNRQLYAIIFYVSMAVSCFFMIFGKLVIKILYGDDFLPATEPLKVITWYTAFSYLGTARNIWMVCEDKQKYLKYIYISAAVLNVAMNLLFIPRWGTVGAAVASLITQIVTSIVLPLLIKDLKANAKLMLEAILFIKVK